ncbi:MAG: hypothetical protein FWE11_08515 [Defluviitaleaceae bacterium]|nr:hypothetical protein [Defluviitaleaceae bacterium]
MNRKRILWITQTALFIAMLVTAQHLTAPMSQFVTGSIINFILVTATILVGMSSGVAVGVVSPIFAYFILGVPIFPVIIPFIMAGNAALVVAVHFITVKSYVNLDLLAYVRIILAIIVGSVLKFLVLWIGVVHVALPFLIPNALPPQVAAMSAAFSWPQLVTALIGSTIAMTVMPNLMRALRINKNTV